MTEPFNVISELRCSGAGTAGDRLEITNLLYAYGLAIDARRWEWFPEIFSADAEVTYLQDDRTPVGRWSSLESWLDDFKRVHAGMTASQHMMLSPMVRLCGDTAHAFCYGLVKVVWTDTPERMLTYLSYYDDQAVRTDAGWRIARRHFQVTLQTEVTPTDPGLPLVCVTTEARSAAIPFLEAPLERAAESCGRPGLDRSTVVR